jgi:hypothetical protein
MHLFRGALKYPSATARKKSVTDQCEIGSTIGDVAGGMPRNIEDLEIETEVWKRNDIAAFDRVIDGRYTLAGWTEYRYFSCAEQLFDTANVVAVVVRKKDGGEFQLTFLDNLDDERGFSRIDDHYRW